MKKKTKLPKFIAIILFKTESDALDHVPLYDETLVLIDAESLEDATLKAEKYAKSNETSYKTKTGQNISWKAVKLVDVNNVLREETETVTEIYSRHFRNYGAYKNFDTLVEGNGID